MGRNIKTLLIIVTIVFLNFQLPKVFADTSCQPIYGGGTTCLKTQDITLNSKILNPSTNKMVDNLGANDAKYQPGFIVIFQIAITNNRKTVIEKTHMQDIFPQFVNFSSGPGSFDTNARILAFDVDNLMPSETRTFNILGRIVNANQLSFPERVICLANQVIASVPDPAIGQDNTQFCIEKSTPVAAAAVKKGGFPVFPSVPIASTPATGPESLALFALIPIGIAGWMLRKRAAKHSS